MVVVVVLVLFVVVALIVLILVEGWGRLLVDGAPRSHRVPKVWGRFGFQPTMDLSWRLLGPVLTLLAAFQLTRNKFFRIKPRNHDNWLRWRVFSSIHRSQRIDLRHISSQKCHCASHHVRWCNFEVCQM